ncbi:MAG: hypothetical protein ACYS8I_07320 [Planctomycetota bacterium]|jgi:hypothetical protein
MIEKISALAVPPGNSLTDPPGKWPWEQPPRFVDPDDVIDYTIDTISNGPARDDMLKLMMAGITVEELVNQITFKGFVAGAFTPDVAELVKPALGIFLVDMALEQGFEPIMFVDQEADQGEVTDEVFFTVLKNKNPRMFSLMIEEMNKQQRENVDRMTVADRQMSARDEQRQEIKQNSFLGVEES